MVFPQLFPIKKLWQLNQDQWAVICQWRAVIKPSWVAFCCQLHHRCHELKYPAEWIFLTELTQCCSAAWIKPNFHILSMKGCKQRLICSCHEKAVVERAEIGSRACGESLFLYCHCWVIRRWVSSRWCILGSLSFSSTSSFSLSSPCFPSVPSIYIIRCYASAASGMCPPWISRTLVR